MAGSNRIPAAIAAVFAALARRLGGVPPAGSERLFISLTSDEPYRVLLAFAFGGKQLRRGHPLTVFVNDRAVLAVSTKAAEQYAEQHALIAELVAAGTEVLVCPMCMKEYGVAESDLIACVSAVSAEVSGDALFRPGTASLTW